MVFLAKFIFTLAQSIATATTFSPTPKQASSQSATSGRKKSVVLHYHGGVSEILQQIFKKGGVHVFFKPLRILRQHLVRPKDEIAVEQKCGVIYKIKCKDSW